MRQAGRYLPEYRELRRRTATFLDFCLDPKLAAEATLQPIRRFGFDAAILFSDILVVPHALGQQVSFETGEGPKLAPITCGVDFAALAETLDLRRLDAVFEALERSREMLPSETALLGFCGAPWTVACYMVAGSGTSDQHPTRLLAYRDPSLLQGIVDRLVAASVLYLTRQFEAGADAVQVFESWAGVLPAREFARWCLEPIKRIVAGVKERRPGAPIIVFARADSSKLVAIARESGADLIGLDTAVDPIWAAREIQSLKPVQGNLDPMHLCAGGADIEPAIDRIIEAFATGPHIFNLGHGILPDTPVAHVERLVRRVRGAG